MSKEDRLRKRKKRKLLRIYLIIIVIIYFIFRLVPTLYASSSKTYTVEKGNIEKILKAKGILVKDEKVYTAHNEGKIVYHINEGQKVAKGTKVADIKNGNNIDKKIKELDEEIKKINDSNVKKGLFKDDIKKNNKLIEEIITKIRNNLIEGNYDEIEELKKSAIDYVGYSKKHKK